MGPVGYARRQVVQHCVQTYGVWFVAAMLAVESMGLPVPGETTLIAVAILSGANYTQGIWSVIATGVIGAIGGSLIGFWLGRNFGYRLLLRYGSYIGLTEARLKIGQLLFRRYGLSILIVCRFLPMLRSFIGILGGINRMPTIPFLLGTTVGAIVSVTVIALMAYYLGDELRHQTRIVIGFIVSVALVIVAVVALAIARYERSLEAQAERELPGPLPPR
jgi:membrane protein DedA with SNARE-associated domain